MAKPLNPRIKEILATYEIDPSEALWDCKGTLVMYHRYIELVCAKAGITFDKPEIIEHDTDKKKVVLLLTGRMGDRVEWSFGEVTPQNCTNAYPWAMAEKRAKDRVALKLARLAGHVYSEEDADDFTPERTQRNQVREKEWQQQQIEEFEIDVKAKLAPIATLETLDELWRSGVNVRLREIGIVDKAAQSRIIAHFSAKKSEIVKREKENGKEAA